jgi:hypothetical protein
MAPSFGVRKAALNTTNGKQQEGCTWLIMEDHSPRQKEISIANKHATLWQ